MSRRSLTEFWDLIATLSFFLTVAICTRNAKCATGMTTTTSKKMNILCLHGRSQSGEIFRKKISGTRRKLERFYDLDFLDGPIVLPPPPPPPETSQSDHNNNNNNHNCNDDDEEDREIQRAWWNRHDDGTHSHVRETFEYILEETKDKKYDAILGFSQGGLLGTALVMTGRLPSVKAVLTSGSPYYADPFTAAEQLATEFAAESNNNEKNDGEGIITTGNGKSIPKLHFAGITDQMVPVSSVERLCDVGGSGRVIQHDKGHMFPTKAMYVSEMLDFLDRNLNV